MKRIAMIVFMFIVLVMNITLAETDSFHDDANSPNLTVGETLFFGQYEQDNNLQNGNEPIEWLVIDVDGTKAFLLSKYVIECLPYHNIDEETSWESSSIRSWLNTSFYSEAFSDDEDDIIMETIVSNGSQEQPLKKNWNPVLGKDTKDKVFLLSISEYKHYFMNIGFLGESKTKGTEYAIKKGAKGVFWDTTCTQLTRSSGKKRNEITYIFMSLDPLSSLSTYKTGIRPAMWINTSIEHSTTDFEVFKLAKSYEETKKFKEAAEAYESLGDYNNSSALAKDCRYQQALNLMDEKKYEEAIPVFDVLGDYKDSYSMRRESRYCYAEQEYQLENYALAAQLYDNLGQYKDSMDKMLVCFDRIGIPVHYINNDNVKLLHTNTEYSVNHSSDVGYGDIHSGWSLGQFIISDFTQKENEFTDHPVFIKTLGNSVTLRFRLEQNIDHLKSEDSKLKINYDTDGLDEELYRNTEYKKTSYGRGALVIRHTNYQNKSRLIGPNTDYLLANGTTDANTKVILNEAGEYEVALDYEVYNGSVIIGNKIENYSIRFNFTIRNGDSPVHFMDIVSRSELRERDVTENGFSINVSNTNALDIHVSYYTIIKESSGKKTLNLNFDRIARDKQEFDREGIYRIKITDPNTKESMEKTLFVGNISLRDDYDSIA